MFDILYDDLGYIHFEDNRLVVNWNLGKRNIHSAVMEMLGWVAEAVIVRRCHADEGMNRTWLRIATQKRVPIDTARKFTAIGTGHTITKQNIHLFNPTDSQRDIIWVDENDRRAFMRGGNALGGIDAGIQVKVSENGKSYFLKQLIDDKYEVPVVYFDVNGDFYAVAEALRKREPFNRLIIGRDFVRASEVDMEEYQAVVYYMEPLSQLLSGRIRPDDLLNSRYTDTLLQDAMLASSLNNAGLGSFISVPE